MIADNNIREFLGGKLSVQDDLTPDFVHGFASALFFFEWNTLLEGETAKMDWQNRQLEIEKLVNDLIWLAKGDLNQN